MNRRGFLGGLIGAVVAAVVPKALMTAPVGESLDLATIDDLVARATRDEALDDRSAAVLWRRGLERQASQGTCFDSFIGPDENGHLFIILHPRQAERLRRACRPVDGRSSKKARAKRRGW